MWDERVKGEFDKNTYQIDVSIYGMEIESVMVEAKDHTKFNSKVSRPELDKLAGSLIEVDFTTGYFFSATEYTRDARRKALGSQLNTNSKSIRIYHLRPAKDNDRENRLETINFTISFIDFDYNKIKIGPNLDKNSIEYLFPELNGKLNIKSILEFKYENHKIICHGDLFNGENIKIGWFSFSKILDVDLNSIIDDLNTRIQGIWEVEDGQIEIQTRLMKLERIMYDISFINISVTDEIKSIGEPVLLVKSDDDELNKLITDNQLKGITFCDKEILFNGATA